MNGIFIVNKPQGFTSHDVVAKLRGILKTRRIGHSGTLDPMATGVLPVFVGRATRACEFATGHDKVYCAEMLLGVSTDSQDITGRITRVCDAQVPDIALLSAISSQVGDISQIPPMYSAVKIGGKKLYQLAREGIEVERKAREITVHSISTERLSSRCVRLVISASKGTYVRTLCADIGEKLGCGATLTSLTRIASGNFTLSMSHTISDIERNPESFILPVDSLFLQYPEITVDEKCSAKIKNGAEVPTDAPLGNTFRVYGENGEFLMLAEVIGRNNGNALKTIKSFFEV